MTTRTKCGRIIAEMTGAAAAAVALVPNVAADAAVVLIVTGISLTTSGDLNDVTNATKRYGIYIPQL